jgi:triacylglycerol lipase
MISSSFTVQPADALTYAGFVKVAYDTYKNDRTNLSPLQTQYISWPDGYTLRYNIHMTDFFLNQKTTRYYGLIAESIANPKNLVIAIRGTEGFAEWWDDFHILPSKCPFDPKAGNVATGFLDLYNTLMVSQPGLPEGAVMLKDTVCAPANDKFDIDDTEALVVAGHSLGASLATLYGLHLASNDKDTTIFTYASPCTGNSDFISYYNSVITESSRVFNDPDLVPKLLLLAGYSHVPLGFELNSKLNPCIKQTIGCFHSLETYMYLLGGPASLITDCQVPTVVCT